MEEAPSRAATDRLRVALEGAVQGVGFRPFVYRLARSLELSGWVLNGPAGVVLEVEGPRPALERLLLRLREEAPPRARISEMTATWLPPAGYPDFEIRFSEGAGRKTVLVLPDLATCAECLDEVLSVDERRAGYPFGSCTSCGPRFTIVRTLPYDRPGTTMAGFPLCAACRAEYEDPRDRRFHAQPIACPDCGPRLSLWDAGGRELATRADALAGAAEELRRGGIVAVKGLGGFHLVCDATRSPAVAELRRRKGRLEKPLALLVRDLAMAGALVELPATSPEHLTSAEAPILLLPRRPDAEVAPEVAPGQRNLGVMLPSTPLHHLLARAVGRPLVATSGNRSEEPICTDEREALERLGGLADLFLVHDRPIERHVDDSVGRLIRGEMRLLRRARGWAPLPVLVRRELPPILAVGAHLKSAVALSVGRQVVLSQHLGDLETPEARASFERIVSDLSRLFETRPVVVAHDLHPGYVSTAFARATGLPLVAVQHHHAHLASCLAENGADGEALGVTWDGTGFGDDGTVWGGELLLGSAAAYRRVAHLRPFRLPGGEAAVREPRRVALALLLDVLGPSALERLDLPPVAAFLPKERMLLTRMLETGAHAPVTTSAGRLFDGVAALLGLNQRSTFEGQAAMALEALADAAEESAWPLPLDTARSPAVLDWRPLVGALLDDLARHEDPARMAARFHNALATAIESVARHAGERRVALTGGCFQNALLTERAADRLERAGFQVLLHRDVPVGDGGICLGQVAVAAARLQA